MNKNEDETLEKQLRDIQIALAEPGKKIVGALAYYLNFLNPLRKNDKNNHTPEERSSTKMQKHNGITWIDIENPNRREINKLADQYPFHPLHLEASLLEGQLPQIETEKEYLFLLLHIPHSDTAENKITTNQVGIFLGKNYMITIHEHSASGIRSLFDECESNEEQSSVYFKRSAGFLLYNVIDNMLKDLSNLIHVVLQELDGIEDVVFDAKVSGAFRIGQLRQKIIKLRRIIGFLKDIITPQIDSFSEDNLARYYNNLGKTITKLGNTIGEAKETIEIYQDADFTLSTEKTNKILAVLTIIFTFTIPATVLGTFYGMNILLPGGLEAGPWTFWGPFTTLYLVILTSILSILAMLSYFKYKNWW